jgi:hypothetical protein
MYLHFGRKAQNIVIHPNDSKCVITALKGENLMLKNLIDSEKKSSTLSRG